MKAAVLKKTGPASELLQNLKIENVPNISAGSAQIIVKVNYASINHRDLWICKGMYSKINLPIILGSDCYGTVYEKGTSVNEFNVGDRVVLNPTLDWGFKETHQDKKMSILGLPASGTFAEFVKINKSNAFLKPEYLSPPEAAAVPLAGLTAYRALFKRGKLNTNENILITGIGGGVASFVLQFAVAQGASVYVTSGSNDKIERAIELGAKGGVNYNSDDWDKQLLELSKNNINLIIDGSAGNNISKLVEIVNYGGRIVFYGATLGSAENFDFRRLYWKQLSILGTTMGSPSDFTEMMRFITLNGIKPILDEVYDLDMIHHALTRMENSEQFGKIVLNILQ